MHPRGDPGAGACPAQRPWHLRTTCGTRVPPAFRGRWLLPLVPSGGGTRPDTWGQEGKEAQAFGCTPACLCPHPRSGTVTARRSDTREPLGQGKCPARPRRRSADPQGTHSQGRGRDPAPGADAVGGHGSVRSGTRLWVTLCQDRPPVSTTLLGLHPSEWPGKHLTSCPEI